MAFRLEFVARPASLTNCSPAPLLTSGCRQYHLSLLFNTMKFDGRCSTAAMPLRPVSNGGKLRSVRCFAALTPELKTTLDKVVTSHKVVVFMKGTKDFPQCGFSNTVVRILQSLNVPFETINILENEMLRQGLKEYSSWPTFPQVYIDGEFFGGCDITLEAFQNGELQEVLEKTMCS